MSTKTEKFDPDKHHSVVYTLDPNEECRFIQFGKRFNSNYEFIGYVEDYDAKLHDERKPVKKQKSKTKVRTLKGSKEVEEKIKDRQKQRNDSAKQQLVNELSAEDEAAKHATLG